MATQNQLELGSLPAVPKLHNPRRDITEGNNVEDGVDFTGDRCRTRVPMVSIFASLPGKLKSFWCVHDHGPAPAKAQKSMKVEKDEEGSFELRNQGGWKTMPFIIGELLPSFFHLAGVKICVCLICPFHCDSASLNITFSSVELEITR